jgi:hypothetical protein
MTATIIEPLEAVAQRSCGSCTLCCKVFEVPVLTKPRDKWCSNCKPGQGCGIWQTRPQFCKDFHCLWVKDLRLEPQWQPSNCKFVMNWASETQMNVSCDPGSPLAYRREPFFTSLKDSARRFAQEGKHILIFTSGQKFVLLPDGERLLGPRDALIEFRIAIEQRFGATSYFLEIQENGGIRRVA